MTVLCPTLRVAFLCTISLLACAGAARAATLTGRVFDNVTGRPLARCRIALVLVEGGYDVPQPAGMTDSSGQFRFDDLRAGAFYVSASRPGYASQRYGQRRADGAGTPVVLGEKSDFTADFRLQRLGAISGRILDENGVGLSGVTVNAYATGVRPLRLVASAVSDDRGAYRVAGLPDGNYYVGTVAKELEDQRGLLPTFFGQAPDRPAMQPVEAALDRETGDTDIQPLPGRLSRLTGTVSGSSGTLWLFSETGSRSVTPSGSGVFSFDQLEPGDYELLARSTGGSEGAYQKLRIREGANQAAVALAPLPIVRSRIDDADQKGLDPRRLVVTLRRTGLSANLPFSQGPLQMGGGGGMAVVPGEYSVVAQTGRELYIRMVHFADGTPANRIVALPGHTLDVVVTVGSKPATIKGKVAGPGGIVIAGAPVFLNALEPDLQERLGGSRMVRAGQDGSFTFAGLPPGSYLLFSSFEVHNPQDADWKRFPAKTVTLEEGAESEQNLELAGGM